MSGSFVAFVCAFYTVCIFSLLDIAQAQTQAQAITDPSEVAALNSIFQQWRISAANQGWNINGEPCTGTAIDSTSIADTDYSPLIKCDCSYSNGSTCHITHLSLLLCYGLVPVASAMLVINLVMVCLSVPSTVINLVALLVFED